MTQQVISPSKLKVTIKTFGCQMNEYDTQVAGGLLEHDGFQMTSDESDADVFIMNTCSVREHAEDKVYSRLGMMGKIKEKKPDMIVGLMGCMVEEHREKLFRRFPALDLMVGTRNIKELPALIEEVKRTRKQTSRIKQDGISIEYTDQIKRTGKYHAWLPVMTGCDKVCTYCIVPITRGAEVSMPAREVYREASRLVEEGVQWITLLGQNVNSYNGNSVILSGAKNLDPSASPQDDKSISFPQLLESLCEIKGLERICFTTSHPHDATEELFQVIAKNPKISRRFHLPLQSGSDRILKRMKRLHTFEEYKEKINKLRHIVPDIAITTDIIVGFSGETDQDHKDTLKALDEIRYDGAYIYKYSLRQSTPAAKLPDDVPRDLKDARHQELLAFHKKIAAEKSLEMIGKTISVFVEQISDKIPGSMIARTDQDRKIVFPGTSELIGTFASVEVTSLRHETFVGSLV